MVDFTQRKTDVLVLAGGVNDDELKQATGEPSRCMVSIGGTPMLELVVKALRGSQYVGKIYAIGNPDVLSPYKGTLIDDVIPEGASLQENFFKGISQLASLDYVLVSSADIPLISSDIVDNLFMLFSHDESDIYYPIIPMHLVEAKFPGGKRTVQKLKEGEFTGGNIFLLNPEAMIKNRDKIDRVIQARKNKKELIKLFGVLFILKYMTGSLDIKSLEKKATSILGASLKAVSCPHAEVGFDVDKLDDYKLAVEVMKKRSGGH